MMRATSSASRQLNKARVPFHGPAHQAGFNMIEVLAALLVMAVGIIGVAALYSDEVRTDPETQLHERAAVLAEKIADRINATREGKEGFAGTVGVVCSPDKKAKSPQAMAAQQAACWEDEVERELPSGLGTVTRDTSTKPETYVVAVSWSSPETGTASYVVRLGPQ
jgi:type IV pilus assembly protein PilV